MRGRHQIRLPAELRGGVELFARDRDLRFAPAVRALLIEGLKHANGNDGQGASPASIAALAALIAAEQTALMVASILPSGEEKWAAMAARAAQRAEERLASLEQSVVVYP